MFADTYNSSKVVHMQATASERIHASIAQQYRCNMQLECEWDELSYLYLPL